MAEYSFCVDKSLSELVEIKITLTNEELEKKLHFDNKTNGKYQNCLAEWINELIEEHKNEPKKSTPTSSKSPVTSTEQIYSQTNPESTTQNESFAQCSLDQIFNHLLKMAENISTFKVE